MGTDIHLYVEEKIANRSWVYSAGELFVWRDYDVFSRLCGVRRGVALGECEAWHGIVAESRGFPESVSAKVKEALSDPDIHSVSWISRQEFEQEFPWKSRLEDMPHFAVVCYPFIWKCLYPVRFVFGFDC